MDLLGLQATVELLAEIAAEKAEHIRVNWQDEPLAKDWDRASAYLETAARSERLYVLGRREAGPECDGKHGGTCDARDCYHAAAEVPR